MTNETVVDVRQEIQRMRPGRRHMMIAVLVAFITLFDGFDTVIPSFIIPKLRGEWHLAESSLGFLVSAGLIGFMIGSLSNGYVADRIGRRSTLMAALWLSSVGSVATAMFSQSYWLFIALRVITGIGLGVLMPLCISYLTEFAPKKSANLFVVYGPVTGFVVGSGGAGVFALGLVPNFGWRSVFYVGGFSALVAIVCHFALPESPLFMVLHGQHDRLRRLLTSLNPAGRARYERARFATPEGRPRVAPASLFVPRYRRTTIVIWICSFFGLFILYGLVAWTPTIMIDRGSSFSAGLGFGILIQVMQLAGNYTGAVVSDVRSDRRTTIIGMNVLGAIAVLVLMLWNDTAINLIFVAIAGFAMLGVSSVLNTLTADSYDTGVRGTGVGMSMGVGRVGGILGPYIGGWLKQGFGVNGFLVALFFAALVYGISIMFVRPSGGGYLTQAHPAAATGDEAASPAR